MDYSKLKFKKFSWKKPKIPCSDNLKSKKWKEYELAVLESPKLVPGMVLKTKDKTYLLVGDVNTIMGVCDDCKNYEIEDIRGIAFLPRFEEK